MTARALRPTGLALAARLLAALALAPALSGAAAEIQLSEVALEGRSSVDLPFVATVRAPAGATLEAEARIEEGRTRLELSWKKAKPALLFGGNVTSYVVWAAARDGAVENLGELPVAGPKGGTTLWTDRAAFALLVTAEAYPDAPRPSDVVVFVGAAARPDKARSVPFTFSAFSGEARPATPSVATLDWTAREPVELVKARKLVTLAEEAKGERDFRALPDARTALSRAEAAWVRDGAKAPTSDALRAAAFASAALKEAEGRRVAAEAARREAERAAKEAAERAQAADEAERRRQAEATLAEVEEIRQQALHDREQTRLAHAALAAATAQIEAERATLAARQEELARAKEAVASRLDEALGKVGPTEPTPRGLVVALAGTLFDSGRTVPNAAGKAAIAKLAGVLLMVPEKSVRVEGHSEPTKNPATAAKLASGRAAAIADLLRECGVAGERIVAEGYGADRPIAPNTTAEGRAANRRIDVVVGDGEIPPPPEPSPDPEPPGNP